MITAQLAKVKTIAANNNKEYQKIRHTSEYMEAFDKIAFGIDEKSKSGESRVDVVMPSEQIMTSLWKDLEDNYGYKCSYRTAYILMVKW